MSGGPDEPCASAPSAVWCPRRIVAWSRPNVGTEGSGRDDGTGRVEVERPSPRKSPVDGEDLETPGLKLEDYFIDKPNMGRV